MKSRVVWIALLALSLATNVWLALKIGQASSPSAPGGVAFLQPQEAGQGATRTARAAHGAMGAGESPAAATRVLERLRAARSHEELRALVHELRAAGVPGNLIRAWVAELIKPRFAGREPAQPFWRRLSPTPEQVAATQALTAERQALLEDLLGADALPAATLSAFQREMRYGNLSDEKLNAVALIERDYDEVRNRSSAERETNVRARISSEAEQHRLLEQEKMRDLAAVLSPAELEQYALRNSRVAQGLMSSLRGLEVTADEFAALYRLQLDVDQKHPMTFAADPDPVAVAARMQAADEANQQARAILTDDRYFRYLESVDFGYASIARFAADFPQISRETTLKVHRLQIELHDAWRQAQRTKGRPNPPDTKAYEARLVELLGPEAAAAYKKQRFGRIFSSVPSGG